MNDYNYNFEITKNLMHFEAAMDDVVIKRYDRENNRFTDSIKVNIQTAKNMTFADLKGQPDSIKYPAMAITIKSMGRDNDRIKNKVDNINYKSKTGQISSIKAIPWNIVVEVGILTKFKEDIDQIIQNFATQSNPYFVYSIQEPISGRDERVEVLWDGQMTMDYPGSSTPLAPKDIRRIGATTTFTIKTWLFKTTVEQEKPICRINNDILFSDKFYCDYNELLTNTVSAEKLSYVNYGQPVLRYVDEYYFKVGDMPTIKINGEGFNDTFALFVSGSNSDMYPGSVNFYPGSAIGDTDTIFNGFAIREFQIVSPTEIICQIPAAYAMGFVDIIAVNKCGYGQLTVDANRCNKVENPYPIELPEHYSWCVDQFPYLNGLIISNQLNTPTLIDYTLPIVIPDEQTIDREALLARIKELMIIGNIDVSELS